MIETAALTVILIILAVFFFIGMIKASVTIAYSDEVNLYLRVLFVKIKILPKKEQKRLDGMSTAKARRIRRKLEKKAEKKRLSAEEKKKLKAQNKAEGKKKSPQEIISMIQMVSSLAVAVIQRFAKHLRIKIARIKLVIATDDAATTAIVYGAVSQSLNLLLPVLEDVKNFQKLKKADISVDCDFVSNEPVIDVKLGFSIRVWQVLHIALAALISLIKHKLKNDIKNDEQQNINVNKKRK